MSSSNSTTRRPIEQAPDLCQCGNQPIWGHDLCEQCRHAKLDEEGEPRIVWRGIFDSIHGRGQRCGVCRKVDGLWSQVDLWADTAKTVLTACRLAERAAARPVLDLREKVGGE